MPGAWSSIKANPYYLEIQNNIIVCCSIHSLVDLGASLSLHSLQLCSLQCMVYPAWKLHSMLGTEKEKKKKNYQCHCLPLSRKSLWLHPIEITRVRSHQGVGLCRLPNLDGQQVWTKKLVGRGWARKLTVIFRGMLPTRAEGQALECTQTLCHVQLYPCQVGSLISIFQTQKPRPKVMEEFAQGGEIISRTKGSQPQVACLVCGLCSLMQCCSWEGLPTHMSVLWWGASPPDCTMECQSL